MLNVPLRRVFRVLWALAAVAILAGLPTLILDFRHSGYSVHYQVCAGSPPSPMTCFHRLSHHCCQCRACGSCRAVPPCQANSLLLWRPSAVCRPSVCSSLPPVSLQCSSCVAATVAHVFPVGKLAETAQLCKPWQVFISITHPLTHSSADPTPH